MPERPAQKDREAPELDCDVVQVKLGELQLKRPRRWGACWLDCVLRGQLRLGDFWSQGRGTSRWGARWTHVFKTLVAYRLIDSGSEWRLNRQWFEECAMADLLGENLRCCRRTSSTVVWIGCCHTSVNSFPT